MRSTLSRAQMIATSAVIGVTIFYIDGEALEIAGPGMYISEYLLPLLYSFLESESCSWSD